MLPRLVLRVRRAVRRLKVAEPQQSDLSGLDNRERWQAMFDHLRRHDIVAWRIAFLEALRDGRSA